MATSVKITILGDDLFRRKIQAMRWRARDMSPILQEVGEDMIDVIEEQFATEGARSGRRWRQLMESTVRRRGSAHPILVETGSLLIEASGPDNINVSDDEVSISLPESVQTRAAAHQYGFTEARGGQHVAARPWADFTEFDRRRWNRKITRYLVEGDG